MPAVVFYTTQIFRLFIEYYFYTLPVSSESLCTENDRSVFWVTRQHTAAHGCIQTTVLLLILTQAQNTQGIRRGALSTVVR